MEFFFGIFFIYKNLHIELFCYAIESVCFDLHITNVGNSVIRTGRREGSLLPKPMSLPINDLPQDSHKNDNELWVLFRAIGDCAHKLIVGSENSWIETTMEIQKMKNLKISIMSGLKNGIHHNEIDRIRYYVMFNVLE